MNACAARYVRLRLDGQHLDLLGIDSGRFPEPRRVEKIVLATGNRADLLVTATGGTSTLDGLGVDRGGMGGMRADSVSGDVGPLATLRVTGAAVRGLPAVPVRSQPPDLRGAALAARRRLVFGMGGGGGMGPGGMTFTIDGKQFDHDRVDQNVALGTVEEWTIANPTPMDHPFHLHVWPMQIIAESGRPVDDVRRQDVANVPARGEVTVRIAFEQFGGRTVYHCHVLDHEDAGMMAVLEAR